MLSFIDGRSLPLLDADTVPDVLVGLALVPAENAEHPGAVDIAAMHFRKWARSDGAAVFLWNECWVGSPDMLDDHLERPDLVDALIIGHGLFDGGGCAALERFGSDVSRWVERTVDVGFEIASQVHAANPYVVYRTGLGPTASANTAGRVGASPPAAFDERFAEVAPGWRTGMWQATLSCLLWARIVADHELRLPPFGEERVRFGAEDLEVLTGRKPRFDATIWGLRQVFDQQDAA